MIAFDTETTGTDFVHGCRPFFVSICAPGTKEEVRGFEWDVDPMTRAVKVSSRNTRTLTRLLFNKWLVGHNVKFDVRALNTIGVDPIGSVDGSALVSDDLKGWSKVQDTLTASHVLASSESHKLKDLALQFLDITDDDQAALQDATNEARRIGRKEGWRIAAPEDPHFPAVKRAPKEGFWVLDTWLPKAVCKAFPKDYPPDHPWQTVLKTYAILDAERTLGLWYVFKEALKDEGLWGQYQTRRKLLGRTFAMEGHGLTVATKRLNAMQGEYANEEQRSKELCFRFGGSGVDGTTLRSPKQLQGLLYGTFGFKPVKTTKTGIATDAKTLAIVQDQKKPTSVAFQFIKHLLRSRKFGKMLEYLDGYEAYGKAIDRDWLCIHPSFNTTGTKTTRFSSHNPNAQNISKQEAFNLRNVFGPMPGRIWYALDYENIEKRIPAFLCGEQELIDLFESGGSYHLLVASIVRPAMFKRLGPEGFKKTDEYRWIKNGNFAEQYSGGEVIVDKAFGVPGGYKMVKGRFKKINELSRKTYAFADKNGFVETLGGYRLQCPRMSNGHVEWTKPFNYFIQGSAGDAMVLALIAVADYLFKLGPDYRIIMTIHDELVLDFPDRKDNLPKVRKVKALMEASGDVLGMPTPVDCDEIKTTWGSGKALTL